MKTSRGFTLIEVLVTLVILSVAFLGLAALVGKTLQYNKSAYARSQATAAAADIVDRLRANRAAALAGQYNLALADAPSGTTVPASDLKAWRSLLAASLPKGTGAVNVTDGAAAVTVRWDDSRAEGTALVQQLQVETRL